MKKIAVVGSLNMDYFAETNQFPAAGETVLGKDFFMSLGGKGANQAIAASRLGGRVSMYGSVGNDPNSTLIRNKMKEEQIDISHLQIVSESHTGVALIEICQSENRIVVIPGANLHTGISYINKVLDSLLEHDLVVFQLETPLEAIEYLVPKLYEKNKQVILNPAPAQRLSPELIEKITYLTPNEHEYRQVLGVDEPMEQALLKYPNKLVITCGQKGVIFHDGAAALTIPAFKIEAVDTTGAGDTFCGALAVALSEGRPLKDSISFGCAAAGLSVLKKGAQTGMPTRRELDQFIKGELSHEAGNI